MKFILIALTTLFSAEAIIVTGRAQRRVPTTDVDVEFEVSVTDRDPAKALEGAQNKADQLAKAVKKLAEPDGVVVSDPDVEAVLSDQGKVEGYEVTIDVEVDVNNLKDLAEVIRIGAKYGQLLDVEYEVESAEERKVYRQLVDEAFEDAESKAKDYAQAIGVKLGELDTIQIDDLSDDEDDDQSSSEMSVEVSLFYHVQDDQSQQKKPQENSQPKVNEGSNPSADAPQQPQPSAEGQDNDDDQDDEENDQDDDDEDQDDEETVKEVKQVGKKPENKDQKKQVKKEVKTEVKKPVNEIKKQEKKVEKKTEKKPEKQEEKKAQKKEAKKEEKKETPKAGKGKK